MNTDIRTHAIASLDAMEPPKAPKLKKAAPAKAKKAPAKKAPAKPAKKAAPAKTKAAKVHPDVQKLNDSLEKSKARLAKPSPKAPAKAAPKAKRERKTNTYAALAQTATGASTIQSPVQAMWNLCDEMQDKRRKEVIEAAVAKGISYYTARTQYQLWLTAFRNS